MQLCPISIPTSWLLNSFHHVLCWAFVDNEPQTGNRFFSSFLKYFSNILLWIDYVHVWSPWGSLQHTTSARGLGKCFFYIFWLCPALTPRDIKTSSGYIYTWRRRPDMAHHIIYTPSTRHTQLQQHDRVRQHRLNLKMSPLHVATSTSNIDASLRHLHKTTDTSTRHNQPQQHQRVTGVTRHTSTGRHVTYS